MITGMEKLGVCNRVKQSRENTCQVLGQKSTGHLPGTKKEYMCLGAAKEMVLSQTKMQSLNRSSHYRGTLYSGKSVCFLVEL